MTQLRDLVAYAAPKPRAFALRREPMSGNGWALHVEVEQQRVLLTMVGEFDLATAAALDWAVAFALESPPDVIVADVTGVTFIDCAGIAPLLDAHRRAGPGGGRVHVSGRSKAVSFLLRHLRRAEAVPPRWAEVTP